MAGQKKAFTFVEVILIVLFLGIFAVIAVPKLRFTALYRKQADTVARKIVTDLRRTRTLAISNAATDPNGFALNRTGLTYKIVDLHNGTTVTNSTVTIDSTITCSNGTSFQFSPLGSLKAGSDSLLTISAGGKTFTITIISATGAVKCR
ncbi:MAG: hypothetical protein WAK60_06540 [Sedimentisphaerales bacterium]